MKGGDLVAYLALYRKYRPNNLNDLVGQLEVVDIIKNEILNDKISHAYLFSGPRGTGKTSTAKIIAKMINCSNLSSDGVPCGKCYNCVNFSSSNDIIEIDAASNNGVDEIRELRENVNLVPSFGKYKVYIIDEVHMLTTQAFNALLKTLEEPPEHIVFILATTEFYKIPVTVASRCQKFQFIKFSVDDIFNRLKVICSNESISLSDDILMEISRLSDGGMRDAINLLDQISSFNSNNVSIDDVYRISGVISFDDIAELLLKIRNGDVEFIVSFVEKLDLQGKSVDRFISDFISYIKDILLFKSGKDFSGIVSNNIISSFSNVSEKYDFDRLYDMINSLNDLAFKIKNSSFYKILLVTELVRMSNFESNSIGNLSKQVVENVVADDKIKSSSFVNNNVNRIDEFEKKRRIHNSFARASKQLKEDFIKKWDSVVENISKDSKYSSIVGIINDITVMVVGTNDIIFVARYDSLVDRLYDNIVVFEDLIRDFFSVDYRVVFLYNDEWNYEKEQYILNMRSGNCYEYVENSNNDINISGGLVDDDVNKIVSILGNDVISYE